MKADLRTILYVLLIILVIVVLVNLIGCTDEFVGPERDKIEMLEGMPAHKTECGGCHNDETYEECNERRIICEQEEERKRFVCNMGPTPPEWNCLKV